MSEATALPTEPQPLISFRFSRPVRKDSLGRDLPVVLRRARQPDLHGVVGGHLDEVVRHSPGSGGSCSQAAEERLHLHPGSGENTAAV